MIWRPHKWWPAWLRRWLFRRWQARWPGTGRLILMSPQIRPDVLYFIDPDHLYVDFSAMEWRVEAL